MKVVILHDWLTGFRGGERILETFCELFPDAPIYTLIHDKGSTSPLIESKEIHTCFLNKFPGIHKHYRKFLPLMPLAIKSIKIPKDTDLVISSSHCVIKGVKKPKGAKHICYLHTPMRYMYDQFDNYFRRSPLHIKLATRLSRPYLQWWDKKSNQNVDQFLPNSNFVQKRVQKYYNLTSRVVNPFVELKDFSPELSEEKDFYIMVTAFAPNKRVDIAINAFNKLGKKLKIIGKATDKELQHFRSMTKSSSIEFLGERSRIDVSRYLCEAKALIFPGIEDFGITPLEAMASGTPIIAYKEGGVLETITSKTGIFFDKATPESLIDAIDKFEKSKFNQEDLVNRAKNYSKERFINEMNDVIDKSGAILS